MSSRRAEVVIIGGGIVGLSVAWHLAAAGCREVLVLDRAAALGTGSTSRATGGFRAQFGSAINVRLSLLAREELLRFEDETGADPGFRQAGYLFLAGTDEELAQLREANALQRSLGLGDAEIVGSREAVAINPALAPDGIAGAAFCPSDGFINPMAILGGYTAAATRLGVEIVTGCDPLRFEIRESRIIAVETSTERFEAPLFVNAAGAWAAPLARLAGLDLPVRPLRRQVAPTVPTRALPAGMPMTIFVTDGFHLRVREERVLLLCPDVPATPDPFQATVDPEWLHLIREKTDRRIPVLREVAIDAEGAWAGLYEMSPDGHAILGWAPAAGNLLFANGSSGHGVMHAPALGLLASEIILEGRAVSIDATPLRPSRFDEGDPVRGIDLL